MSDDEQEKLRKQYDRIVPTKWPKAKAPEVCKRMQHCKGTLHVCGRLKWHNGKHVCFCKFSFRKSYGFDVCETWNTRGAPTNDIRDGVSPIREGMELFTCERKLAFED